MLTVALLLFALVLPLCGQRFEFGTMPVLHLPMASDAGAYRLEADDVLVEDSVFFNSGMFQDPPAVAPIRYKVTFMPQGAEALIAATGKKISGIGLIGVSVCDKQGVEHRLSTGHIKEAAAEKGISLLVNEVGVQLVNSTVKRNKWQVVGDVILGLVDLGAGVTVTGLVKASASWASGFVLGGQVGRRASSFIKERAPDTGWVLLLLKGPFIVPANDCFEGLMMWRYSPHMTVAVAEVR